MTGELGEVDTWFIAGGPQFEQFQEEAVDLAEDPPGDPPYTVTVGEPEAEVTDGEARVRARVVFVRTGEPSQSFDWVVVLHRVGEGWRIWTVEEP